jgi:hypothetical protein
MLLDVRSTPAIRFARAARIRNKFQLRLRDLGCCGQLLRVSLITCQQARDGVGLFRCRQVQPEGKG